MISNDNDTRDAADNAKIRKSFSNKLDKFSLQTPVFLVQLSSIRGLF